MAMPSSGTISLGNANTELGKAANALASLNDSNVRTLFGKASGAISLSDGYGKANAFGFNIAIAANTQNYNLKDAAIAAGWNQTTALNATVTVNSGVVVGSASTGSYAFDTGVTFPAGSSLKLINNGTIIGRGGNGGHNGTPNVATPGGAGGPALRAQVPISITNNGRIAGAGHGGASGYGSGTGDSNAAGPGGGGAGSPGGSGGGVYWGYTWQAAASGSLLSGGGGGAGSGWGSAGSPGGEVGSSGAATSGNANITWVATGTRNGALN
jgi:hypothetical protein